NEVNGRMRWLSVFEIGELALGDLAGVGGRVRGDQLGEDVAGVGGVAEPAVAQPDLEQGVGRLVAAAVALDDLGEGRERIGVVSLIVGGLALPVERVVGVIVVRVRADDGGEGLLGVGVAAVLIELHRGVVGLGDAGVAIAVGRRDGLALGRLDQLASDQPIAGRGRSRAAGFR